MTQFINSRLIIIEITKIVSLKSKKQTIENFMDYESDLERKSFWYWQWQEMYCNTRPLKKNIL